MTEKLDEVIEKLCNDIIAEKGNEEEKASALAKLVTARAEIELAERRCAAGGVRWG